MRLILGGLLALLSAPCMAESAGKTGDIKFQVAERQLSWSLPDGYCLPEGDLAGVAQIVASADTTNVTNLTLYRCNSLTPDNQILIKTPRSALMAQVSRAELLESVGKEFESSEFAEALSSGKVDGAAAEGLKSVFGDDLQATTTIKPLGRDEVCAYMGGSVRIESANGASSELVGVCITSVNSKVVLIYRYGEANDVENIIPLVKMTRTLADSLIARNEVSAR